MATGPKYKKAPDAPKRFKSAFIIFSAEKHKEIKDNFAKEGRSEKVRVRRYFDATANAIASNFLFSII
jgi:hypothetical protein